MSAALRLLSTENRSAMPRESFRAFSKIMCGHPDVGGERIPSLNWYEDNDIKSFLGKNGTEDTDLERDNNTSKRHCTFFVSVQFVCSHPVWIDRIRNVYGYCKCKHLELNICFIMLKPNKCSNFQLVCKMQMIINKYKTGFLMN